MSGYQAPPSSGRRGVPRSKSGKNMMYSALIVLALLIPPAAVALTTGCDMHIALNLCIWVLVWPMGILHAWCIIIVYGFGGRETSRRANAEIRRRQFELLDAEGLYTINPPGQAVYPPGYARPPSPLIMNRGKSGHTADASEYDDGDGVLPAGARAPDDDGFYDIGTYPGRDDEDDDTFRPEHNGADVKYV